MITIIDEHHPRVGYHPAASGSTYGLLATYVTSLVWDDLHHGSATQGDEEHEEPAGDEVESPCDVGKGEGDAVFNGLAVERVEPTLTIDEVESLLATRGVEVDEFIRGRGSQVESPLVDLDRRRGREHLEDVEVGGCRRPGVAEDGLVVAVHQAHVGSTRKDCELGGRLVEGRLDPAAVACGFMSILCLNHPTGCQCSCFNVP